MEKDPQLASELARLNTILDTLSRRLSPGRTFLNGMLGSLGSFFGTTVVLGIIVYVLIQLDVAGLVGNWLTEVISGAMPRLDSPAFDPAEFFGL